MQENEGETEVQEVTTIETEVEALEAETEETKETTDWKSKHDEVLGRLKRAETKLEKSKIEKKAEAIVEKQKTGELDDATLDFFELKGYSDPDQIEVFHKIMLKTGMSHREVIKDDYALTKVKSIQDDKERKEATPSSSKRSSGTQTNDLAAAIAKYEATGKLPEDFTLRSAVINAKVAKEDTNKPAWH